MKMIVIVIVAILGIVNGRVMRMVDGDILAAHEPYTISIRLNGQHICAGALVTYKWIVTTARCVRGYNINDLLIWVGSKSLGDGGTTYAVAATKYHNKFSPLTMQNDIGLIQISGDLSSQAGVATIELNKDPNTDNMYHYYLGWGKTTNISVLSSSLRIYSEVTIDITTCDTRYPNYQIIKSQICGSSDTSPLTGKACIGDAGDPVIISTNSVKLAGIVSFDNVCGNGKPDVFTRISYFAKWIIANTKR